jgi:hypothetical protein
LKNYQEINKEKIREKRRLYRLTHSEEIKAKRKEYDSRPEVKEKKRIRDRIRAKNNPEKVKERYRRYYLKKKAQQKE